VRFRQVHDHRKKSYQASNDASKRVNYIADPASHVSILKGVFLSSKGGRIALISPLRRRTLHNVETEKIRPPTGAALLFVLGDLFALRRSFDILGLQL
jgi:hypothetical protein